MKPDLDAIRANMRDPTTKWNILLAQADRTVLMAYVEKLETQLAERVPVNAYHASCPSCGAPLDVVPPEGTTVQV